MTTKGIPHGSYHEGYFFVELVNDGECLLTSGSGRTVGAVYAVKLHDRRAREYMIKL